MKKVSLIFMVFVVLGLLVFPLSFSVEIPPQKEGNITFERNTIPDINVYYEDYSFVFSYKSFFIRIRPFIIYEGQYYGMKQIVTYIKNNFPNVNYNWLIDKAVNAIHYGFNLTRLPENVADKIDYLGFRLVDLNFPLSWFELEELPYWEDINGELINVTRIKIPRANLEFTFEDLFPYGYSVEHINSTYILIGNVKGKADLYVDPITRSVDVIEYSGFSEGSECTFWDLWNASNANGWNQVNNTLDRQFTFWCKIRSKDNTESWFADEGLQVFSRNVTSGSFIHNQNLGHFRLGKLEDASTKETSSGCQLYAMNLSGQFIYADAGSETEIYDSHFYAEQNNVNIYIYHGSAEAWIYETTLNHIYLQAYQSTIHVFRINQKTGFYGLNRVTTGDFDDVLIEGTTYASYYPSTTGGTITNLKAKGNTYVLYSYKSADVYLVNPSIDIWNLRFVLSDAEVYRQCEFELTVTYPNGTTIENANVTISHYGEGGGIDYDGQSDSNGQIPTQTLTMGFYNQTGGNTIYDYNPYCLNITYGDQWAYFLNFTLSEKTDWIISVQDPVKPSLINVPVLFVGILFIGIVIAFVGYLGHKKKRD